MEEYDLEEIMSGENDDCYWVTIGFSSELEEFDVLHVVCGKSISHQDRRPGMDGIYLERFDQAYGGYSLAHSIQVSNFLIQIDLNESGKDALGFDGIVTFRVPKGLKGLPDAMMVFTQMTERECGRIIKLAQHDASADSQGRGKFDKTK